MVVVYDVGGGGGGGGWVVVVVVVYNVGGSPSPGAAWRARKSLATYSHQRHNYVLEFPCAPRRLRGPVTPCRPFYEKMENQNAPGISADRKIHDLTMHGFAQRVKTFQG